MPKSKLTDDQTAEIRRLYAQKGSREWGVSKLASAFGVTKAVIQRVVRDVAPGYVAPSIWEGAAERGDVLGPVGRASPLR